MSTRVNFLRFYNYIFKYLVYTRTKACREGTLFRAIRCPSEPSSVYLHEQRKTGDERMIADACARIIDSE